MEPGTRHSLSVQSADRVPQPQRMQAGSAISARLACVLGNCRVTSHRAQMVEQQTRNEPGPGRRPSPPSGSDCPFPWTERGGSSVQRRPNSDAIRPSAQAGRCICLQSRGRGSNADGAAVEPRTPVRRGQRLGLFRATPFHVAGAWETPDRRLRSLICRSGGSASPGCLEPSTAQCAGNRGRAARAPIKVTGSLFHPVVAGCRWGAFGSGW